MHVKGRTANEDIIIIQVSGRILLAYRPAVLHAYCQRLVYVMSRLCTGGPSVERSVDVSYVRRVSINVSVGQFSLTPVDTGGRTIGRTLT